MGKQQGRSQKRHLFLLAAVLFAAVGVFMFVKLTREAEQWRQHKAMVERGDLLPEQAQISKMWKVKRSVIDRKFHRASSSDYKIQLDTKQNLQIQRTVPAQTWEQLEFGDMLTVYQVDGGYFVPDCDLGGQDQSRWVFLAISLFPVAMLLRARRRRARADG